MVSSFNPFEKCARQIGSFPQPKFRGEHIYLSCHHPVTMETPPQELTLGLPNKARPKPPFSRRPLAPPFGMLQVFMVPKNQREAEKYRNIQIQYNYQIIILGMSTQKKRKQFCHFFGLGQKKTCQQHWLSHPVSDSSEKTHFLRFLDLPPEISERTRRILLFQSPIAMGNVVIIAILISDAWSEKKNIDHHQPQK